MATNIDVQFDGTDYVRDFRPILTFWLELRGNNNWELKFGEIWLHIKVPSRQSNPLLTKQAISLNESLHQQNASRVAINIELTDSDLERIEKVRGGGKDLKFEMKGEFHSYDSRNERFEYVDFKIEDRIPRSDWADILTEFGYGDIRVVEFRFPDSPAREHFEKAWKHVEDADDQFALGNWGETLTHCRQAVEVVDNLEQAEDVEDFIGEEKWDRLGRLKGDLDHYLSLGPHSDEGIGHELIKRRDAQASLLFTKALINYVGDAMRERGD